MADQCGEAFFTIMPYMLGEQEHFSVLRAETLEGAFRYIVAAALTKLERLPGITQSWRYGAYEMASILHLEAGDETTILCPCGDELLISNRPASH